MSRVCSAESDDLQFQRLYEKNQYAIGDGIIQCTNAAIALSFAASVLLKVKNNLGCCAKIPVVLRSLVC